MARKNSMDQAARIARIDAHATRVAEEMPVAIEQETKAKKVKKVLTAEQIKARLEQNALKSQQLQLQLVVSGNADLAKPFTRFTRAARRLATFRRREASGKLREKMAKVAEKRLPRMEQRLADLQEKIALLKSIDNPEQFATVVARQGDRLNTRMLKARTTLIEAAQTSGLDLAQYGIE